jgi:hypothetical protein
MASVSACGLAGLIPMLDSAPRDRCVLGGKDNADETMNTIDGAHNMKVMPAFVKTQNLIDADPRQPTRVYGI